ncbi:GTP-binding protein [Phenylobacterium sp.]|uniref:CobW family GTP-binding protein n=1 Tax=Phenylobacterium sp. TaxID=1871053 RepID=UPI0035B0F593
MLGGFLGAGKTTLVNHLLRHADGRRIMVMVNDFGELAIDADLIQSRDGETMALANGCACCSTGGDLLRALIAVLDGPVRPDHLLIEASGVADPDRLADVARADPDLRLSGVVVMVDSGRIETLLADPRIGGQVAQQLASADLLVLNKQDLAADPDLAGRLQPRAPGAAVVAARHGALPADLVLGELAPRGAWRAKAVEAGHEELFARWTLLGGAPLAEAALRDALAHIPHGVLRLKGFVVLDDGRIAQVQAAGGPGQIEGFVPAEPSAVTRLVAIGPRGELDRERLDRLFSPGQAARPDR